MPFASSSSSRGFSKWGAPKTDDPYTADKIQAQIDNASTRIKDAGFNVADADQRNWFEKGTNLPQGQNWFFDTLEILGRPGNAVKNVIDKTARNETQGVGEALYRGFSGRDKVSGADLAEKLGFEGKVGKFTAGLGLDIALDPTTFIPGGVIAKGLKAGTGFAAKPIKVGYGAFESAVPALKTFRETKLAPAAESFKDGLGYMFKPEYKIEETLNGGKSDYLKSLNQSTENSRQFMQENTLADIGRTARDAGGLDGGVDAGRILEAPLRQFEDVKGYEFPDGLTRTTEKKDLLNITSSNASKIGELGKELSDTRVDLPTSLTVGAKAFELTPKVIAATKRKPAETVYVKPKGAASKEIEELQDVNGQQMVRFKGETALKPAALVRALGTPTLTKQGEFGKFIGQTADELEKTDREIRRLYFSKENAALRQLTQKKNKPVNIDELAKNKAFSQVSTSPKFNYLLQRRDGLKTQLDQLRSDSKQAKSGNIQAIKTLVDENTTLRESLKNPVMIQKELPRPQRDLSTDPKIQQAAKNLMQSNTGIRQFAEQNGIAIPELEGYMTHVWSAEERAKRIRVAAVDRGASGTGNPSKSILNTRKLTGSAEDVNEKLGRNFFEANAFYASAIGQKRLVDYIHAVSFRRQVLSNKDFAKKYKKGDPVPPGAEVIDTNNYKFLKESGDILDGVGLADEVGGQYIVTKQAKQLLDRYQRINTDEGTKAFLKVFDTVQSFWKRGALFSLGYHVRNQAGALFNNYVGGMNPIDIAKYTPEAFREVARAVGGKESALFTEYRGQGLSSSSLSQVEFARYGEEPEKAIERTVRKMSATGFAKAKDRTLHPFETSQEVGNFFDQANRFALYKWSREKMKMTAEEAAAKVREVQFDYSKTTPFERNVVARVVPFYRWMRNNIPFQIKKFIHDPRPYGYLNKWRINAQEVVGLDEENVPDYMKENFAIPISGENGKGKFLSLNLPLGDLTKLSRPGKTLVDAITPLAKTPMELALNYNMFRRKPIEQFEGQQKQFELFGKDFGISAKKAYAVEQATGQIGRGLSSFLQKPESVNQDDVNRLPSLGISSLTKPFDAEKYDYYQRLDQLKQMQDLMRFIEQQTGAKPRTVNEIKKGAN